MIQWEKIIKRICPFYNNDKGAFGKSLRMMIAILVVMKFCSLSDRGVINQVKENRYIQYFCNVPDVGLQTFLNSSSLCVFRKRLGVKGIAIVEEEIFKTILHAEIITKDALIDTTVLSSNIIYPNDVHLIFKAFKKMDNFAKLYNIHVWWDEKEIKMLWREFRLNKEKDRETWLAKFNALFIPALNIFGDKIDFLESIQKEGVKARYMFNILSLLEQQTIEKLGGNKHIENRIVSIDEPDARPIKKGKTHPDCEFGTTMQMVFSREGFLVAVENFIGNPNDKKLFPGTIELYKNRMKGYPDTITTDLGFRSKSNFEVANEVDTVFLGRSNDVAENKQDFCRKARSATEGFIAVAKNLRGFGRSLYRFIEGDRIWSLLCQTAYNLKKFIQLYQEEKIQEKSLIKLGLL